MLFTLKIPNNFQNFGKSNFSIRFFQNLLEVTLVYPNQSRSLSSSVFRSKAEKNVSRTREPHTKFVFKTKTSRYGFCKTYSK